MRQIKYPDRVWLLKWDDRIETSILIDIFDELPLKSAIKRSLIKDGWDKEIIRRGYPLDEAVADIYFDKEFNFGTFDNILLYPKTVTKVRDLGRKIRRWK